MRAGLDGLLLVIVVLSADSEMIDRVIKKAEYAAAGVPRCWIVDRDKGNTVEMYKLVEGEYDREQEPQSLAWVCNSAAPELG